MAPYQERVVAERAELAERTEKLKAFNAGPLFQQLPTAEQVRLLRQQCYMNLYWAVLTERIEAFT